MPGDTAAVLPALPMLLVDSLPDPVAANGELGAGNPSAKWLNDSKLDPRSESAIKKPTVSSRSLIISTRGPHATDQIGISHERQPTGLRLIR